MKTDWIETIMREVELAYPNVWLQFSTPLRVVSEANLRDHHMVRYKRKKAQQKTIHVEWRRYTRGLKVALPCIVRLVRIGPQRLDDDNLAGAFKAVRDQIAKEIGVDDGSEQIRFEYSQIAIGKRKYAVSVEVYEQ